MGKRYTSNRTKKKLRRSGGSNTSVDAQEVEDATGAVEELLDALMRLGKVVAKPFKPSFSKGRLEEAVTQFGELASAARKFAGEFAKTKEGEETLANLSEGTKVFGQTALSVASGAAKGFAKGGPIGAAIGGLTGLVQEFAGEYVEAHKRIDEANATAERAIAEHASKEVARLREAVLKDIETQYKRELEVLEDQNEELDRQKGLRSSLRDLNDAQYDLEEEKQRSAGVSEEELERKRINYEAERDQQGVDEEAEGERKRLDALKGEYEAEMNRLEGLRKKGAGNNIGTKSPEYLAAEKEADQKREIYEDARADFDAEEEGRRNRKQAIELKRQQKQEKLNRETRERKEREEGRNEGEKDSQPGVAIPIKDNKEMPAVIPPVTVTPPVADIRPKLGTGDATSSGRAPLGKTGVALADGTDDKELAKLAAEFAQATQGMRGATLDALRSMVGAQQKQAEEIRKLQGKGRTGGDVQHA